MRWRQYRPIKRGEFFIIGGDCSQGGRDYNACQFFSKTQMDVPLVYQATGVAVQMTTDIFPVIEKIQEATGVIPVVGFERSSGGASELDRLLAMNRFNRYSMFVQKPPGHKRSVKSTEMGWNTTAYSRGAMLGDLKDAIDTKIIKIYDEPTVNELWSFIEKFRAGRWQGEAEAGMNDDLVMALAGTWMMAQESKVPASRNKMVPKQIWDSKFLKKFQ